MTPFSCASFPLTQADALTTAELDEYRQQVRDKLAQASSRAGRPIIHAFTPEELQAAGDPPCHLGWMECCLSHLYFSSFSEACAILVILASGLA